MIEVRNLIKNFGWKRVLRGLDFRVERGESVAILGPNGAGKTTLLRILATLARPNGGSVRLAGYSLPSRASEVRRRIGVILHQPLLYGDLTAEENLRYYGRMYGVSAIETRIDEMLHWVGLEPQRRELVRKYSRGMQQRLAIGRALLHAPDLLLFDEPFTGLDPEAASMLETILGDATAKGNTLVMTSHDLPRVAGLVDRMDILSKGGMVDSIRCDEETVEAMALRYRSVTHG
ncbi:MAG: heme ABC exporter ATP-binding protein CcmA [Anaerolineales bacterium]|jgi:heme exporter protein A